MAHTKLVSIWDCSGFRNGIESKEDWDWDLIKAIKAKITELWVMKSKHRVIADTEETLRPSNSGLAAAALM